MATMLKCLGAPKIIVQVLMTAPAAATSLTCSAGCTAFPLWERGLDWGGGAGGWWTREELVTAKQHQLLQCPSV